MSIRAWFSVPAFVCESPEFVESWEFQRGFTPDPDTDYSWIPDYARFEYQVFSDALKNLDDKADKLIQYLGAGTVFVSLLSAYSKESAGHVLAILPTAILLLVSLGFAVFARAPQAHHYPPFAKQAFEFAECYNEKDRGKIEFFAKFSSASVALKVAGQFKARWIRCAFRFFFLSIVWLVASIAFGL